MYRTLPLLLLVFLACPAVARAQFDDDDSKEAKAGAAKGDDRDPFGTAAEEKAWQAWLRALGPGPVYRVEALYRHHEDGRLYYLRTLFSEKKPGFGRMFGLGLDEKGGPLPPPDPRIVRVQKMAAETVSASGKVVPPPRLADTTRYVGIHLERDDIRNGRVGIFESDLGTSMLLPKKPGAVEVAFRGAIFIVEHLTPEQLAREQPLRQDPGHFQRRTAELRQALMTTHLPKLLADERALANGARTLRDPRLLAEARRRLNAWIEKTPAEVKNDGPSTHLTGVLQVLGDAGDFEVLHRLAQRHPDSAHHVLWNALYLAKRLGGTRAGPVWEALVKDTQAGNYGEDVRRLRAAVPALPEPTRGDEAVLELVYVFKLDPRAFHLRPREALMLEHADQVKLTAKEREAYRDALEHPSLTHWLFVTEADRTRGHLAALQWLAAYKPPRFTDPGLD
jgi:hypothetical protein